jgi:hypothetical protein
MRFELNGKSSRSKPDLLQTSAQIDIGYIVRTKKWAGDDL